MPSLHAWTEGDQRLRVLEQPVPKGDKEAKALACYGVRVSCPADPQHFQTRVWLRFVDGRPVSAITTQFLAWTCEELERAGKKVWVLIWDNAPWHVSKAVRAWIRAHNKQVKREGRGARILVCYLPPRAPGSILLRPAGLMRNDVSMRSTTCSRARNWPTESVRVSIASMNRISLFPIR